jgi:lysophospholipase L1-like esterase
MAQWAYAHQAIPLILTLGNPHDTRVGLVGISEAHQANILAYRAAQAQAATQSHALYTDMTPIFAAEQSAGNDKLFLDSVHPSPTGHFLIAQALFQTLLSSKDVRQALTVP